MPTCFCGSEAEYVGLTRAEGCSNPRCQWHAKPFEDTSIKWPSEEYMDANGKSVRILQEPPKRFYADMRPEERLVVPASYAMEAKAEQFDAEDIDWRHVAEKLWGIIDDIDAYSDVTKGNYNAFYSMVMKRQADRAKWMFSPDGYSLVPGPAAIETIEDDEESYEADMDDLTIGEKSACHVLSHIVWRMA